MARERGCGTHHTPPRSCAHNTISCFMCGEPTVSSCLRTLDFASRQLHKHRIVRQGRAHLGHFVTQVHEGGSLEHIPLLTPSTRVHSNVVACHDCAHVAWTETATCEAYIFPCGCEACTSFTNHIMGLSHEYEACPGCGVSVCSQCLFSPHKYRPHADTMAYGERDREWRTRSFPM